MFYFHHGPRWIHRDWVSYFWLCRARSMDTGYLVDGQGAQEAGGQSCYIQPCVPPLQRRLNHSAYPILSIHPSRYLAPRSIAPLPSQKSRRLSHRVTRCRVITRDGPIGGVVQGDVFRKLAEGSVGRGLHVDRLHSFLPSDYLGCILVAAGHGITRYSIVHTVSYVEK